MTLAGRILAGVAGWVLALGGGLLILGMAATLHEAGATTGTDAFADVFAAVFSLLFLAAGIVLIRSATPGVLEWPRRRLAAALRNRALICNPLVHGLAVLVAGVLLSAVAGPLAILVVFVFGVTYAIGSPLLIAGRPGWWLNAILSLVVFLLLLGLLTGLGEAASRQHFGDDAMIMVVPVLIYPAALAVSLALHLSAAARRRRAEATSRPAGDVS